MSRIHLLYQLLRNNRLADYRRLLQKAQQINYQVCGVHTSLSVPEDEKILVLRHDVDHVNPAALRMGHIENELGICATYYFRWETFDLDLIQRLQAMGHECSLHYETFATYAEQNNLEPHNHVVDAQEVSKCQQLLGEEISEFRQKVDDPTAVKTIASHGHELNRLFDYPNHQFIDQDFCSRWQIELEAYEPSYLGRFDAYLSDCAWNYNDGWRYGADLWAVFEENAGSILFLTHPSHWLPVGVRRYKMIRSAIYRGRRYNQNERFAYQHLLRN